MGARKKTVNLTIDGDLLDEARQFQVNLSQLLARNLEATLREKRADRWKTENQDIVAAYQQHFDEHGCLSDEFRNF